MLVRRLEIDLAHRKNKRFTVLCHMPYFWLLANLDQSFACISYLLANLGRLHVLREPVYFAATF